IGFSMSAQAMTTLLMIKGPIYRASQANVYITGSVYGSNWQHVKIAIILSVILLFICFVALKNMNIQVLGEDIAAGAGSAVQRNRFF
ncbi:iron chelate uptake ABC transporter family permease subunit, partial [Staphylococcus aureus]